MHGCLFYLYAIYASYKENHKANNKRFWCHRKCRAIGILMSLSLCITYFSLTKNDKRKMFGFNLKISPSFSVTYHFISTYHFCLIYFYLDIVYYFPFIYYALKYTTSK